MARGSLRRYDVQAKVAFLISCAAALGMLALVFLLFLKGNYRSDLGLIIYGSKSLFGPAIFLTTAVTMLLAATGAAMGVNSAGQKRNELTRRSWAAFFLGSATISITIILFAAFWMLGQKLN